MATRVAVATISNHFREAYRAPILESAYYLWERTFRNVSDEDLEQAAWNLISSRSQYDKGQVRIDEITRELADMGIRIYQRTEDLAFVKAMAKQFPEDNNEGAVSLAEFRKMDKESGQAVQAYLEG
ncbi:MAG: hypothetical protein KAV87_50365 [Desulfobacteraceae bacterium]|nr:hypothetical protein [Desulfobacteraceae bacterium]